MAYYKLVVFTVLFNSFIWFAFFVFKLFPHESACTVGDNSCLAWNAPQPSRATHSYMPTEDLQPCDPEKPGGNIWIHSYHEGPLFPGFEIMYDAYLVTQDLGRSRFIQWISEDWKNSTDPHKRDIALRYGDLPNIEFRLLDHFHLAKGTCFETRPEFLDRSSIQKYGLRDWSNVIRWLLLSVYGGVWIDSDSVLLLDLLPLQRYNSDAIVAGYVPDPKRADDKEAGQFNNNLLLLTSPTLRKTIIDVACEFRRKPLGTFDKHGNPAFENVIPTLGPDNHQLRVVNKWLFNDGVLRRCWMREDCTVNEIGLGETDPTWLRTNDMYDFCEIRPKALDGYTSDFNSLLQLKGWQHSSEYIDTRNWKDHIWVVHTRASHCRFNSTLPLGYLSFFGELAKARMGATPLTAPRQPTDFLSFDTLEVPKASHAVENLRLIITYTCRPHDFADRQVIRAMYEGGMWHSTYSQAGTSKYKVLFIIPYTSNSTYNALLHGEQNMFGDLVLVDSDYGSYKNVPIGPVARKGLLKILNHYEAFVFLVIHEIRVFVNIHNLFALADTASGQAMFQKEKNFKPLVVTHRTLNKKQEDNFTAQYNSTSYHIVRGQKFVLFTRSLLGTLLGVANDSSASRKSAEVREHRFTMPPTTYDAVESRVPQLFRGKESKDLPNAVIPGTNFVVATTPDHYSFASAPLNDVVGQLSIGASSYHPNCGRSDQKMETKELTDKMENMVMIWDLPCVAIIADLATVSGLLQQSRRSGFFSK